MLLISVRKDFSFRCHCVSWWSTLASVALLELHAEFAGERSFWGADVRLRWSESVGPYLLRRAGESFFFEVTIEGKCVPDSELAHHLEARTIDEAELAPGRREQGGHAESVDCLVDVVHLNEREEVIVKGTHGFHAQAVLTEGAYLDHYVVCR